MCKKTLLTISVTSFFLFHTILPTVITETESIEASMNQVNRDTLVLLNISGTLYQPSTTLANNQWREYFTARVQHLISDSEKSQILINKVKNLIVQNIPKTTVEDVTPSLIASLQQQKIPVLGITEKQIKTSYAENFALITSHRLNDLGIDLENTFTYFKPTSENNPDYTLAYGIIFANKKPVGKAIKAFLNLNHYTPSQIIMLDNSLKSLESVEAALASSPIAFKGFRYGRADAAMKQNFDPTLGTIEFFAFMEKQQIMMDAEAIQIKRNSPQTNYEALHDDYIKKMASAI